LSTNLEKKMRNSARVPAKGNNRRLLVVQDGVNLKAQGRFGSATQSPSLVVREIAHLSRVCERPIQTARIRIGCLDHRSLTVEALFIPIGCG
jgi:hypothetical protein